MVATVLKSGDNSNEIRYVGLNHVNMNSMDPFGLPVPGTRYPGNYHYRSISYIYVRMVHRLYIDPINIVMT